jgi:hypothetical protein
MPDFWAAEFDDVIAAALKVADPDGTCPCCDRYRGNSPDDRQSIAERGACVSCASLLYLADPDYEPGAWLRTVRGIWQEE